MGGQTTTKTTTDGADWRPQSRPTPLAPKIKAAEVDAHAAFVKSLGDDALWTKS
jgi:DNA polymerase-3 subunit epsilon